MFDIIAQENIRKLHFNATNWAMLVDKFYITYSLNGPR